MIFLKFFFLDQQNTPHDVDDGEDKEKIELYYYFIFLIASEI